MTHWALEDPNAGLTDGTPSAVRRAQRFLEIVEAIADANRPLVPSMTEKYFRRMVLRMAEHQLLYEEYQARGA
jgi:hypothetical protein